jgi:ribose transport system substrate-binding protein
VKKNIFIVFFILAFNAFMLFSQTTKSVDFVPLVADNTDEVQKLEGIGPNGEKPEGVDALKNLLTAADEKKLKSGKYTAAICMHFTANDWSQLQLKGMKATFDKYGVKILTVTDAKLKIDQQISDYESAIQLKPSMLLTLPIERDATASILKKAREKGIILSFIDSVPANFKHPADYSGMGTADNYANGRVSAETLAEKLNGKGKIALINYKASMFHTDQRSQAARETFAKYPGIKIVAEQSVLTPEEAATVAESMLTANPDLNGMWTVWDGAGMAAASAIKNLGKKVYITTVDLSFDSAYSIASGGLLIGTGAQHPYDQGVAEAMIALAGLLGKATPPYILVPGEKVTKKSMIRSWNRVFREVMPKQIEDALKK